MPLLELQPMPLRQLPKAFDHPDWIFEVKYAGLRALTYLESGRARLISHSNYAYDSFADLRSWMGKNLAAREAVIDGEIVCFDRQGRPILDQWLLRRGTPAFCAFDLLWFGGRDLRELALIERKQLLRRIIPTGRSRVIYVDHLRNHGVDLFEQACRWDLEGIVAKWKFGPYSSDEERSTWFKIRNPNYTQTAARGDHFARKSVAPAVQGGGYGAVCGVERYLKKDLKRRLLGLAKSESWNGFDTDRRRSPENPGVRFAPTAGAGG